MQFNKTYKIGPNRTQLIMKALIGLTISISLIGCLIGSIFQINYITYILGLSLYGIKNYFLWQLVTYNFLQPSNGITISFIIELLFNLYLIWIIGTSVIERISQIQYLIFYVLSSIFAGLTMLFFMSIGYPNLIYSGPTVSLYATLIAWMMLNPPNTRIFLFFAIPIKHYWLVLGLIGFNLFASLSSNQFVIFFGYMSVCIFAYFYSVIIWNRFSPFHFLNKMERYLIYIFKPIIEKFKRRKFH